MLCYCYDMFHVIVMMCHRRPGVLQVIKVTAHIRATLTKIKVDDPSSDSRRDLSAADRL